ncbi:hypothetical protein FJT64_004936 [Amphibalanus amphitrite]|uniref:Uncharacterized protein n=1 Tax=Amphibalanus amphitrite TaxID=1232801 RepID=A0A6A4W3M1_AMPAM|nr:hypothetical protein FJT64_004936 [Amphibalanus amphitrite]
MDASPWPPQPRWHQERIQENSKVLASRRAAPTRAMPPGSALTAALTSQAAHIAFQPPTQTGVIQSLLTTSFEGSHAGFTGRAGI